MKNEEIKKILEDMDLVVNYNKVPIYYTQKQIKTLLDYITNLQQKINDNNSDISNLTYQLAQIKENNQSYQEEMTRTWKIADDYKSRCKKAIELYKNCKEEDYCILSLNMYEVLNGSDEK